MNIHFLNNAQSGKNSLWRYLLGGFLSLACWVIGYSLLAFLLTFFSTPAVEMGSDLATDQPAQQSAVQAVYRFSYLLNTAPFIFLIGGLWLVIRCLHRRSLRSLITAKKTISWRRFLAGFGVWFGLASLQTGIEFGINPKDFSWTSDPLQWLIFLPLALVLTPIQTSAEELFFRGYLLQAFGRIIRQPIALAIATSLPFAFVHFSNPEMQRGAIWIALSYLLLALFLTVITLKDGRLELALGVHAANNLFIVLIVNTPDSVLRSPSIITRAIAPDPQTTFLALLLTTSVFYVLFFGQGFKLLRRLGR